MLAVDVIRAKRNGKPVTGDQLKFLVDAYTDGSLPDYQMAAFLMAVYFRGMTTEELGHWTNAMLHSGEVLDFSDMPGKKIDKHSTGGVGDKVSLILAPLAVAAGLKVPMISGRGLGHTGGTLDKLESIPGFNVNLTNEQFRAQVADLGCSLIGQTTTVAPADKKIYALRDVTGTVECRELIASSIMSKKLAEGIDALVLDVKVGSGAFMKNIDDARLLAQTMIDIGKEVGTPVRALLTDMSQPLGRTIGNALEVRESIETLQGNGPEDLTKLTVGLVAEMLDVAGQVESHEETEKHLHTLLEDGSALRVFRKIVSVQGGDVSTLDDLSKLPTADHRVIFKSPSDGYLSFSDASEFGRAALELGAGRRTKDDAIDHAVGIVCLAKQGQFVAAGEPLFEIHHNSNGLENCQKRIATSIVIAKDEPARPALIQERLA